ncbi:MAG: Flp pilus assembly protein CpaB [Deltaproteobacteria bacterium]|nr:Flp pilus assembly protein CpaB [Deltaproteobacteria bacterium]
MDKKKVLIISSILAVIAVALVQFYAYSIRQKYTGPDTLTAVVIASQDIPAETIVSKEMLAQKNYHKDFVPRDAILASDYTRILGSRVTVDVQRNEPLLVSQFMEGAASTLAPKILSGMVLPGERASTILVDEQTGVAGLLRPGDHVDVIGTFVKPGRQTKLTTITLIQNLPVLAVGGMVGASDRASARERSARAYRSVTLSVTLEEAELLTFAQQKSKLTLVLRNAEDAETLEEIPEINFDNIFEPEVRKKIQRRRNSINKSRITIIQ